MHFFKKRKRLQYMTAPEATGTGVQRCGWCKCEGDECEAEKRAAASERKKLETAFGNALRNTIIVTSADLKPLFEDTIGVLDWANIAVVTPAEARKMNMTKHIKGETDA